MDEFEQRLKHDAEKIDTGDTAALRARIDASIRATNRIRPVPETRDSGIGLWWASSITGLAAALVVIVLINVNRPDTPDTPAEPVVHETVPEYIEELQGLARPEIRTADFTSPLEDELVRLRADIERARQTVREEIALSF